MSSGVRVVFVFALMVASAGVAARFPFVRRMGEFVVGKAMAASGLSAPIGAMSAAADTKAMKEGLDFAGNLTQYTTTFVGNASDHVSHVARQGLNSTAFLGRTALEGGVKVGKQGLAFAKTIGKHIPGYSAAISVGTDVGSHGLTLANTLGQKGISLAAAGGDKALHAGHRVVKGGADKFNAVAQTGISLGKNVVDRVDKVKNGVLGGVDTVKNNLTGALSRIPGGRLLFRSSSGASNSTTAKRTRSLFA